MSHKSLIKPIILISSLSLIAGILVSNGKDFIEVNASTGSPTYVTSLVKDINLNKSSNDEIRNYYASLNSLSNEERSKTNLLKNLRPILQDMNYFNYDTVWSIYEITDREWELSPASETTYGQYDPSSNFIKNYEYATSSEKSKNDPYVKTLYRNRDENGITISEARIKEWGSHKIDGTNREHIWCQSRGFKADSGAKGPAGTDLHHLRSGDAYVNQSVHNDNPYGYVDKNNIEVDAKDEQTWLSGNYLGKPKNPSPEDTGDLVFEPQDSNKGDIARAIFYMAACYNNLDGNADISEFNPNLAIADYIYSTNDGAITSNETTPAVMSKLSDLLQWHKLDPVDEFEIYRNDLIFNNYQHNRNPFIDFPDWVEVVWGDSNKVANPSKDIIHGSALNISKSNININIKESKTFTLSATSIDGSDITWSVSDSEILGISNTTSKSGEEVSFTINKVGETLITATIVFEGETITATCKVVIIDQFIIQPWMYIALAAVVVIVFIIVMCVSKNARKKVKKEISKQVKKSVKRKTKTSSKTKKGSKTSSKSNSKKKSK